jgi:hypothetical protein
MMLPVSILNGINDRMINDYGAVLRGMRWVGHVAQMREMNSYTVSVRKHEGTRPFGKPKPSCIWKDNTLIDFNEIRCEVVDCI